MLRRRTGIWVGVVLGALLVGCQTLHEPQPQENVVKGFTLSDEADIGPDGGVLSCGPYTLTIPQGALSTTVHLTMEQISPGEWPVELSPDGTQFYVPATLSMDAAGEQDPQSATIHWWNPSSQQWEPQATTHSGTVASTQISHFSRYILI